MSLVENKAAILIKDNEFQQQLMPQIEDLINSPEALNNISDALERFKVDNASDLILAQVNELLNTYFGDFN